MRDENILSHSLLQTSSLHYPFPRQSRSKRRGEKYNKRFRYLFSPQSRPRDEEKHTDRFDRYFPRVSPERENPAASEAARVMGRTRSLCSASELSVIQLFSLICLFFAATHTRCIYFSGAGQSATLSDRKTALIPLTRSVFFLAVRHKESLVLPFGER